MQKAISILVFSAAVMTLLLSACDTQPAEEPSTDFSDKIIAAIDKSSPISQGNLITKTNTDDDGNLNISYYDSKGNMVESFIWKDNEKISHSLMTYSDSDKLVRKEEISPDGQSNKVESYKYDANDDIEQKTVNEFEDGKLRKSTVFDADNNVTGYTLSFYSDSDLLTKIERYDEDEDLVEYFMYEYNNKNQNVKYSAYDSDKALVKYTTFEYNEHGKVSIERYFDNDNKLQSYYTFEYFDNGDMMASRSYDSDGNLKSEDFFEKTTQ